MVEDIKNEKIKAKNQMKATSAYFRKGIKRDLSHKLLSNNKE